MGRLAGADRERHRLGPNMLANAILEYRGDTSRQEVRPDNFPSRQRSVTGDLLFPVGAKNDQRILGIGARSDGRHDSHRQAGRFVVKRFSGGPWSTPVAWLLPEAMQPSANRNRRAESGMRRVKTFPPKKRRAGKRLVSLSRPSSGVGVSSTVSTRCSGRAWQHRACAH